MIKTKEQLVIRAAGKTESDIIEWVSESVRKLLYFNPVGQKLGEIFPQYFYTQKCPNRLGTFITIDSQSFIMVFQDVGIENCAVIILHPVDALVECAEESENLNDELKSKTKALRLAVKDIELQRLKLKQAHEATGTGSFEYMHDQKCLLLTPEACKVLGMQDNRPIVSMEEICKQTAEGRFTQLCDTMSDAYGKTTIETEISIKGYDGEIRHLRVMMKKLAPGAEALDGLFQDITFQKDAEKRLRLQDTYYRTIYDNATVGICTLNSEGRIIDCNSYINRLTGYTTAELGDTNVVDLLVHEDDRARLRAHINHMKATGENVKSVDFRITNKSGNLVELLSSFELLRIEDDEVRIFGFVNDITGFKQIQDKNIEQERMLLQQSKMATIGEMIGIIAHQWVQPLNSIAMISQMLQELLDLDEESNNLVVKTVSSINDQISFMLATANDFKNFLKPSENATVFSVADAVNSVLDLYRPQLKYYYIQCGVFFESEELRKSVVYGYENEFKNVILNLCTNAKDALENSGTENAEIEINISTDETGKKVIIAVIDNGGGIPQDVLDKLFTAYVSSKGEKGTGLGLYMSKLIINERMNGEISASNTENGAKITITLENKNA